MIKFATENAKEVRIAVSMDEDGDINISANGINILFIASEDGTVNMLGLGPNKENVRAMGFKLDETFGSVLVNQ